MLMALGQFVFSSTILSFNELQRQRQWQYSDNAVASGRPKKQFIGAGQDAITLTGNIYQEHGFGLRHSLDILAAMADTGQGFVLVDGSGYICGVYIIDSIDETKSTLLDLGVPRKIDFTLKLTRTDDNRIEIQSAP